MRRDIGEILWEEDLAREREWQAEQWVRLGERRVAGQRKGAMTKTQWHEELEKEIPRLKALGAKHLKRAIEKLAKQYRRHYLIVRREYRKRCLEKTLQKPLRA